MSDSTPPSPSGGPGEPGPPGPLPAAPSGSAGDPARQAGEPAAPVIATPVGPGRSTGIFGRLPWEKMTIWALFLFFVYSLRQFFPVIFMTFIFSYIMTSIVGSILRVVSPRGGRQWLHRPLVIATFVLLLASLYGLVVFLEDPFREQINRVKVRFSTLAPNPQTIWDDLARNTIGRWRYEALYRGKEGRERKETDLENFREQRFKTTELERFKQLKEQLESGFKEYVIRERGQAAFDKLVSANELDDALRAWIISEIAPAEYTANKDYWDSRYKEYSAKHIRTDLRLRPGPMPADADTDAETAEAARQDWVYAAIAKRSMSLPPEERAKLDAEFKRYLGERGFQELSRSEEYEKEFRAYYEKLREVEPDRYPYDYEKYVALSAALTSSEQEFHNVLMGGIDKDEQEIEIERSFRRTKQTELARETLEKWNSILRLDEIRARFQAAIPQLFSGTLKFGRSLFQLVVYFALSLLLSFFITFDLPRIRKGLARLGESRVRDFYHEIAPGLAAFGSLIGRAFQAQAVIAICNTLLTLGLLKLLGIGYEIFLCTIVFICSFIPVLGVVFSTVPIALVPLIEGNLFATFASIGGVLIIHFVETSILNPKILGEMLHLHPVLVLGILVIGEHFFHIWGLLLGVPVMVYIIRYVILDEGMPSGPRGSRDVVTDVVAEPTGPPERVAAPSG